MLCRTGQQKDSNVVEDRTAMFCCPCDAAFSIEGSCELAGAYNAYIVVFLKFRLSTCRFCTLNFQNEIFGVKVESFPTYNYFFVKLETKCFRNG